MTTSHIRPTLAPVAYFKNGGHGHDVRPKHVQYVTLFLSDRHAFLQCFWIKVCAYLPQQDNNTFQQATPATMLVMDNTRAGRRDFQTS